AGGRRLPAQEAHAGEEQALRHGRAPRVAGFHEPNRCAARALALAASSSRFRGAALVSSDVSRRVETSAISSMAARKEGSLAFEGLFRPLILRTNCSEAARISSAVT